MEVIDVVMILGKSADANRLMPSWRSLMNSQVPKVNAGLSSSAAVELVTAYALNALGGLQYSTVDLVQLAQKAENEYRR